VEQTSQSGPPTRSDRQRERTRRRLLDAGRTLIAERGVSGLRIQEITERADIALGSFYNYFPAKEDLVEAVVAESLSTLAAATLPSEWEDADPAEVVAAAILRVVRLAFDDPDFARLVVNLAHADDLFLAATHPYARIALERGIADDRFEVVDIEVALTAIIGAAFALIDNESVYLLEGDLGSVKKLAGQRARVVGTRTGNTIKVASITSES